MALKHLFTKPPCLPLQQKEVRNSRCPSSASGCFLGGQPPSLPPLRWGRGSLSSLRASCTVAFLGDTVLFSGQDELLSALSVLTLCRHWGKHRDATPRAGSHLWCVSARGPGACLRSSILRASRGVWSLGARPSRRSRSFLTPLLPRDPRASRRPVRLPESPAGPTWPLPAAPLGGLRARAGARAPSRAVAGGSARREWEPACAGPSGEAQARGTLRGSRSSGWVHWCQAGADLMALVLQGRLALRSLSVMLMASGQGGGLAGWIAGGPPRLSTVDIWEIGRAHV